MALPVPLALGARLRPRRDALTATRPLLAAIVGVDGCGKSSTFTDVLASLAPGLGVAGVGDEVVFGSPSIPLGERTGVPHARLASWAARTAKGLRVSGLYKNVKFLDLVQRAHVRDYLVAHDRPAVMLTDGDSLINTAAWALARFYRHELSSSGEQLAELLRYLAGRERIPLRRLPYLLAHSWQLVLFNLPSRGRFVPPELVFLLTIDPEVALARIRARGKPLQAHETAPFLAELGRAYEQICCVLEQEWGVTVVRIPVDHVSHEQTVQRVVETLRERVRARQEYPASEPLSPAAIEVIATTMSGSLKDQQKVGRIAPVFQARTDRAVHVHTADSHAEAQTIARDLVTRGARLLVSAGGAGTFNAVLEGAHLEGRVPPDLRLAFLRKGSADLIGKMLKIPDELEGAVQAILDGIESDNTVPADILAIDAQAPGDGLQQRHLIGFGGFGVFGDIPRISETRIMKYYKGVLGTLFGDLGPFYVSLALATCWWEATHLVGRRPPLILTLDGRELPPAPLAAVVVVNGDLGREFPLGRGMPFASGSFRVIALRYRGLREALRQLNGCRTAALLDQPRRFGALVRDVRTLTVRRADDRAQMVNVDGLRLTACGEVRVTISGQVTLVAGGVRAH